MPDTSPFVSSPSPPACTGKLQRRWPVLLLLAWLPLARAETALPPAPSPAPVDTRPLADSPEPDEYALWSRVISHGLEPAAKRIVIALRTAGNQAAVLPPGAALADVAKRLETPPALLQRWLALNQASAPLEPKLSLAVPYEFLGERERAGIFDSGDPARGWAQFHTAFPDAPGFLRLSRAAFDETGNNALVYIEFHCGERCGSGRLIRAQREGTRWQLLSGELLWMTGP